MHYQHPSYFAKEDFRHNNKIFGIHQKDRLHGMLLLGKSGSGKTNLMKVLLYQDIICGRGACLMDVNGDFIREIIDLIPEHRKQDIVYLDASNPKLRLGYNPLKKVNYAKRALIASSILETFQKLWGGQSWGIKLEYILRNSLLLLLDQEQATLDDIPKVLLDNQFRDNCLVSCKNPHVIRFFKVEYPKYSKTDILPVLNKVGSFLSIPMLRKILVSNTNQLSLAQLMNEKKIFLVNLSKGGLLGSDGAHLLGSLLITAMASAGFNRVHLPPQNRHPFIIYLDEFQNFTTGSIAGAISELRKFGVSFVLANQYLFQLNQDIKNAVLGNIGTLITFRLGQQDAKYFASEFYPTFQTSDFTSLAHYHIYLRLLIGGKISYAFSAKTITIQELINHKSYLFSS